MTAALAAVVLACFILGAYVLACLAWRGWAMGRVAIVVGFIAIIASVGLAAEEIIGRPKPVEFEWREIGEVRLLHWTIQEGVAIWLWVLRPGEAEPVAYRLPWEPGQAQQLFEAEGEAMGAGVGMMMNLNGLPGEPMAWPEPQQPSPPKE